MSELAEKKCVPCEGGVPPLGLVKARKLAAKLRKGWSISPDGKSLQRTFKFKDFYRTMSFVGAVAHIANVEDHHPDLEVSYDSCRVSYSTHAIGGLSSNDFICAAKVDRL